MKIERVLVMRSDLFSPDVICDEIFEDMTEEEFGQYKDKILSMTDDQIAEIVDVVDYHDSRLLGMGHDEAMYWNIQGVGTDVDHHKMMDQFLRERRSRKGQDED